ncbi:MAG: MBL fold metallo-hydrolase [Dehalococcoidia bacterium]|nr:MBL fold metallo-hydrolase [Dehalococcoidia bacterium]
MKEQIQTVSVMLPFMMGSVNCYVVKTDDGFFLIDTGASNGRKEVERKLDDAGCKPGDLKLIILTHGDFDHTGNAAYLRQKFGARIAMHRDDAGMLERGDIFWNRKSGNLLIKALASVLFRFGQAQRCSPDLYLNEGDDLSEHGFDAKVLHILGHSKGSIAVLTAEGALFSGDLLLYKNGPVLNSIMDDRAAAQASFERLKGLNVSTVYPGHGEAFRLL